MKCYLSSVVFRYCITLLSLFTFFYSCKLADIRPVGLINSGNNPDLRKKAISIISHPLDVNFQSGSWKNIKQIQFTVKDVWHSKFIKFFTPIKDNEQRMKVFLNLENDSMEIEFLNGVNKGLYLGLEKKDTYRIAADTGKVFTADEESRIYLESLRFYLMIAWSIQEFEILQYSGESKILGYDYDRIFLTSIQAEPSPEIDQYVAHYEKETGVLEWLEFTYRDIFIWYKGVLKFGHYEAWDGKLFPRRITILNKFSDDDFVHELRIERVDIPKRPLSDEQIIQEQN